ncbi:H+transporting two-sector ATPase alpha/beta subunit domain-containing protein [Paenibacillus dendritiformis C454]|uniref:H+transporting two-sector ATPase alpha/beta subunit domain-containing protein n=1 Tax=Paenibacillus dendritiformis C454 TaxID=1131935 RepID=H3SP75_9BACL|nr:H+transporting two-sector ATPase alpha/beta subunit domain-containing protein [Paenibacillus dendritiformis C454]
MLDNLKLNVSLLRQRVPNLTSAARTVGLRPATVSNLCTGKIPVGRAEVRTIAALAELAKCSLDELILRGEAVDMIETRIKPLDLFAPLAKGGTVGLVARPGMGQLVLLGELFHNLGKEGYGTILLKPEGEYPELSDLLDGVDQVSYSIEETYRLMADAGPEREIVFAADREHVLTGGIYDLQERLLQAGITGVTTFLVDLKGLAVDEDLPYGPLETLWHFDADLAARLKFPAVNPLYSTSSILEGVHLDPNHLAVQQRAQKLLRRYRELRSLVQVKGLNGIPGSERHTYDRGERLEAYLTQPFHVAEAYTGRPGAEVGLHDMLQDVQAILNGSADHLPAESLLYIGRLPS